MSISVGSAQASSKQTQTSDVGAASSLSAGGNIKLNATGAAENSNLTVRGSDLQAGGGIQLKADNPVNIVSGGDTTLKGAVVSGKQVTGDIGGNLNIQSLRDTAKFDSKSQSASGTVAYLGASVSASASLAQTKVSADYLSVNEQSSIKAVSGQSWHLEGSDRP